MTDALRSDELQRCRNAPGTTTTPGGLDRLPGTEGRRGGERLTGGQSPVRRCRPREAVDLLQTVALEAKGIPSDCAAAQSWATIADTRDRPPALRTPSGNWASRWPPSPASSPPTPSRCAPQPTTLRPGHQRPDRGPREPWVAGQIPTRTGSGNCLSSRVERSIGRLPMRA